jgi:hypothetical protein
MRAILCISALSTTLLAGGCTQTVGSTPTTSFQEYTQRIDTVTVSAGDAQAVNSRIQEIDPWPRYVGDVRIVSNGERIAGAVERNRDVSKQERGPQPLPIEATQ